ncbi:MAG: transposase [Cyanosarcina radialis HA8281-LM2]|nr:transposase [Cyanosarcina radialis HA8281-LM2]
MLLGFKTELKLNNQQQTQLLKHAGTARHAWNWGLALTKQILSHNKENQNEKIKFPSTIDLHKWLVAMVKPERPWYYEVSKCAPQYALRDLRTAWDRYFKKVSGVPRFKRKGRDDSFTVDGSNRSFSIEDRAIKIPFIGWLRTYERLPQATVKSVTISRTSDRWFISFRMEIEPKLEEKGEPVGVDLGLLRFATFSTGEEIDSPRPFKAWQQRLAKLQYHNRNKVIGSNNWKKAQVRIARRHARIANIRKDFIHKVTTRLAKNHSQIVIEDLNVTGMMANGKLSKAIADSGFYEFRRQLAYKTQLYGSSLVLANRWFPSSKMCFGCGTKKEHLPLSVRTFQCECGYEADRDVNAAKNLLRLVRPEVTPADKKMPTSLVEAGSFQFVSKC